MIIVQNVKIDVNRKIQYKQKNTNFHLNPCNVNSFFDAFRGKFDSRMLNRVQIVQKYFGAKTQLSEEKKNYSLCGTDEVFKKKRR